MTRLLVLLCATLTLTLTALAPFDAVAFCGFYVAGGDAKLYNDATQVVLLRGGNTTVLSMQNNYEGPAQNFAMVVPVPQILQKENVKTLDKGVFDTIDQLSAPRLVEYWEQDPCNPHPPVKKRRLFRSKGSAPQVEGASGSGSFVKVEAQFEVGEYDIVILSTNDAAALDKWLKDNSYSIPAGAEPYFRPYVQSGSYFFVAKVDAKRVTYRDGGAVLSPLRFHYESEKFTLPVRLGMINSKGQQDLLVYVLGKNRRYEVANYPNVTIPTNIEVAPSVKTSFGEFYEALFSRTLEENPKAVVTEYAWPSGTCDPCPTGNGGLPPRMVTTLGGDAIDGSGEPGRIIGRPRSKGGFIPSGWTLTRLHARYAPDDIGEDLVLKEATPITGGREVRGEAGLEKGATPAEQNNFQGRYIIRHEWTGEVNCPNPERGVWGGPPSGGKPGPTAAPSANTRGKTLAAKVDLPTSVREPIPELRIQPGKPAPSGRASTSTQTEPTETAPLTNEETAKAPASTSGCATATTSGTLPGILAILAGLFMRRRRRS